MSFAYVVAFALPVFFLLTRINPFSKEKNEPFEIDFKQINSITVDGYRDPWGKLFTKDEIKANITTNHKIGGLINEVHIPVTLVGLPMAVFAFHLNSPTWKVLCLFGVGSAILLTAHEGYKNGKERDYLTAIDNIEKKRIFLRRSSSTHLRNINARIQRHRTGVR